MDRNKDQGPETLSTGLCWDDRPSDPLDDILRPSLPPGVTLTRSTNKHRPGWSLVLPCVDPNVASFARDLGFDVSLCGDHRGHTTTIHVPPRFFPSVMLRLAQVFHSRDQDAMAEMVRDILSAAPGHLQLTETSDMRSVLFNHFIRRWAVRDQTRPDIIHRRRGDTMKSMHHHPESIVPPLIRDPEELQAHATLERQILVHLLDPTASGGLPSSDHADRHAKYRVYGRGGGGAEPRSRICGKFFDQELVALGYTKPWVKVDEKIQSEEEAMLAARVACAEARRRSMGLSLDFDRAIHSLMSRGYLRPYVPVPATDPVTAAMVPHVLCQHGGVHVLARPDVTSIETLPTVEALAASYREEAVVAQSQRLCRYLSAGITGPAAVKASVDFNGARWTASINFAQAAEAKQPATLHSEPIYLVQVERNGDPLQKHTKLLGGDGFAMWIGRPATGDLCILARSLREEDMPVRGMLEAKVRATGVALEAQYPDGWKGPGESQELDARREPLLRALGCYEWKQPPLPAPFKIDHEKLSKTLSGLPEPKVPFILRVGDGPQTYVTKTPEPPVGGLLYGVLDEGGTHAPVLGEALLPTRLEKPQ